MCLIKVIRMFNIYFICSMSLYLQYWNLISENMSKINIVDKRMHFDTESMSKISCKHLHTSFPKHIQMHSSLTRLCTCAAFGMIPCLVLQQSTSSQTMVKQTLRNMVFVTCYTPENTHLLHLFHTFRMRLYIIFQGSYR